MTAPTNAELAAKVRKIASVCDGLGTVGKNAKSPTRSIAVTVTNLPSTPQHSTSPPTASPRRTGAVSEGPMKVIPIPIRPDLTVHVGNLPYDLTPAEAARIERVVLAMVNEPPHDPAAHA